MAVLTLLRLNNGLANPLKFNSRTCQYRYFWEYVNKMFNMPDPTRIKQVGPDRACAEWVLRNGGKVVWADGQKLVDYNKLPSDSTQMPQLMEIDGSESSISHYGFPHLSGCNMLQKIVLHNNNYIDDRALDGLTYGKESLIHVQVSKCPNVTDVGLKKIKILFKLNELVLFDLQSVENLDESIKYLKAHLPKCDIRNI